ncbi:GIY-YIG nuclease family protein [Rubrivirga sp. S365]|uniref:GIY-YIG nuclease family protein n=1 Tax=Rubrivirga litoralis TaxID=3075598 RepID=A0ABU3BLV2_9BACT|nr:MULTISPECIES: GIY-YIG nuclease family protein [unclassified Rubrivirga]MDT0630263.1 GIY-YIG nuclease family protein [Rubrivirga sp. F394]MDT7855775.1 GIY-YIG nuclease family protein [Rubrivirga sp. S365]
MPRPGYVYLLASRRNGTLYVGVTSDLVRRVAEHRGGAVAGFTADYAVHRLVYVEAHADVQDAIRREKQIKKWRRAWKLRLIEESNSAWRDLYADWCEALTRSRPAPRNRPSPVHERGATPTMKLTPPGFPPARE